MDLKSMIAQAAAPHMQQINTALESLSAAIVAARNAGFAVSIRIPSESLDMNDPYNAIVQQRVSDIINDAALLAELQYSATVREQA